MREGTDLRRNIPARIQLVRARGSQRNHHLRSHHSCRFVSHGFQSNAHLKGTVSTVRGDTRPHGVRCCPCVFLSLEHNISCPQALSGKFHIFVQRKSISRCSFHRALCVEQPCKREWSEEAVTVLDHSIIPESHEGESKLSSTHFRCNVPRTCMCLVCRVLVSLHVGR